MPFFKGRAFRDNCEYQRMLMKKRPNAVPPWKSIYIYSSKGGFHCMTGQEVLDKLQELKIPITTLQSLRNYAQNGLIDKPSVKAAGKGRGKTSNYGAETVSHFYAGWIMTQNSKLNILAGKTPEAVCKIRQLVKNPESPIDYFIHRFECPDCNHQFEYASLSKKVVNSDCVKCGWERVKQIGRQQAAGRLKDVPREIISDVMGWKSLLRIAELGFPWDKVKIRPIGVAFNRQILEKEAKARLKLVNHFKNDLFKAKKMGIEVPADLEQETCKEYEALIFEDFNNGLVDLLIYRSNPAVVGPWVKIHTETFNLLA